MAKKTPAIQFITNKLKTTSLDELFQDINLSPLKQQDKLFLTDIINGYSYKELAEKYQKSEARVYQWKRTIFENLQKWYFYRERA